VAILELLPIAKPEGRHLRPELGHRGLQLVGLAWPGLDGRSGRPDRDVGREGEWGVSDEVGARFVPMVGWEIGSRCQMCWCWSQSRSDIVAARLLPMVGGEIIGRCQWGLGRGWCRFIGHIDVLFRYWTW
jgi:hypothetical protein